MAAPCRIRPTSRADIAALVALEERAFSDPWTADQLGAAIAWSEAMAAVAEDGEGRILGHIVARLVVDQGEILSVATDPAHRRRGIASLLLDGTLRAMEARRVESVWLEVRVSNVAAQALYQGRGFVAAGRRRGYYRAPVEDALVLRKAYHHPALPSAPVR